MKSKAPLLMMEQMVMILVFALAAALCLQAFVLSDRLSREGERQDRAVLLCQNAAEGLRASGRGGEAREEYFDEDGAPCEGPGAYRLTVTPLSEEVPGLCSARLEVTGGDGESLFVLEKVSWQEVG